jgi:hypothetical protein
MTSAVYDATIFSSSFDVELVLKLKGFLIAMRPELA